MLCVPIGVAVDLHADKDREAPSPESKNAPRLGEVLLVDFASPTQAIVKVRVRIDTQQFLDYLSWHCIDGAWRITAKSFHVERDYEAAEA
jgi:hypothetical protein